MCQPNRFTLIVQQAQKAREQIDTQYYVNKRERSREFIEACKDLPEWKGKHTADLSELMPLDEAIVFLNRSQHCIAEYSRLGYFKRIKVGRNTFYSKKEIIKFKNEFLPEIDKYKLKK